MKPAPRRWEIADPAPVAGYPGLLGRVLAARGHDAASAAALLEGPPVFHDPFTLAGMPDAVIAVAVAVERKQPIAVYGDYDADGVTACALLTLVLRAAGAVVLPYIPNRMTEGYGLHGPALEELAAQGVGCVVTVDCGTSSADVVARRPAQLRLVITDHHLPLPSGAGAVELPAADALVNPKRPDCTYAFDALAGAGVAWKLVQALEAEGVVPAGSADQTVALAALGTVADMMPLRDENRAIVAAGLQALGADPSPGVRALLEVAGVRGAPRAADLAFAVAPRINAAGRMEDAQLALQLCLAESLDEARPLAERLQAQNLQRQEAVARALIEAEEKVAALPDDAPAIVLGDERWPMGIVGLVAGRISERYARPTFVVSLGSEEAKGSARSVPGVHIVAALGAASACLLRYGGHVAAAGFSLEPTRFEEFQVQIAAAVADQLGDAPRQRVFAVDTAVSLGELTPQLCAELSALEPCGQGNREPLLAVQACRVVGVSTFGNQSQHLRIALGDGEGRVAEAVAFNKPGLAAHLPTGRTVDACFGVDLDQWDGLERVRLRLRDLRPATPAAQCAPARNEPEDASPRTAPAKVGALLPRQAPAVGA